ncbi:protein of unknown function [Tenacibaculum sp. 190524A02b]|uniref:hypothetical protein n=1 Tax=Tenacibaculum vairaonense TaxID=3137860 RepID=UPI0032B30ABE
MSFENWVKEQFILINQEFQKLNFNSKSINELTEETSYKLGMFIPVYDPTTGKTVKFPHIDRYESLSGYQLRQEKGEPNGYVGLNSSSKINEVFIPDLPISRITSLQSGLDRDISGLSITGDTNKILTLTRYDGSVINASFKDIDTDSDVFLNSLNFNISTGVFTAVLNDNETSSVSLDGRYSLLSHKHSFNDLTDLPTSFVPSEHYHDDRYLKLTGGLVSGDMTFDGESTFNGTSKFDDDVEVYGVLSTDAEVFLRDNVFCEHSIQVEKSIVIDKNKSLSGIANSIFTVKKDSTVPGIDVASFIDVNRNTPTNATSDCYGSVVRLKNASNFDSKGLIAANYVANHVGGGNADYLYGSLFKSAYNGSGNIDFMLPTSHKLEIKGIGVGTVDYARGLSPHILIDNPNITVNNAQGMHPTIKYVNGTIKDSHVLYLDVDYDTNGSAKIIGDFAYIQAGNDQLPAVEGSAHFIKSLTTLPSLFSGIIEMNVSTNDIKEASNRCLLNKQYADANYLKNAGDLVISGSLTSNAFLRSTTLISRSPLPSFILENSSSGKNAVFIQNSELTKNITVSSPKESGTLALINDIKSRIKYSSTTLTNEQLNSDFPAGANNPNGMSVLNPYKKELHFRLDSITWGKIILT